MEEVTEYYPGRPYRTKVWITDKARGEMDKMVHRDLGALFETWAKRGFHDYRGGWLRKEGDGIWAFGTLTWTTRIAGYFPNENRDNFIICGVWDGKPGRGGGRPPRGDSVVHRVAAIRAEGVKYV